MTVSLGERAELNSQSFEAFMSFMTLLTAAVVCIAFMAFACVFLAFLSRLFLSSSRRQLACMSSMHFFHASSSAAAAASRCCSSCTRFRSRRKCTSLDAHRCPSSSRPYNALRMFGISVGSGLAMFSHNDTTRTFDSSQ